MNDKPPEWLITACKPWVVEVMPDGYNSAFGLTAEEVAENVWAAIKANRASLTGQEKE